MSTAAHAGNHTGLAFERARSASSSSEQPAPQPTHPDDQASRLRALVEAGALDLVHTEPDADELDFDDNQLLDDNFDDNQANTEADQQNDQQYSAPSRRPQINTTAAVPSAVAASPPPRLCKRIAVVSGKGGVGKSNVAVNLAIALAATGRRTSLVDADLGTANADVLCGLPPAARLEHALPELDSYDGASRSLQDIAINAPGGFQLIPGSAGLGRIADLDPQHRHRLLTEVETLEPHTDAILIDTSAGIGAPAIMFARWADAVVLVCTPEPTAMADAYAMLKAMARSVQDEAHNASSSTNTASLGRRVGIVVNQVPTDDDARAAYRRIAGVCDRFLGFRPVYMGWIPYDREVPASVLARKPLLLNKPRARSATHIRQLAERLAEQIPIPYPAQPATSPATETATKPNPARLRQPLATQGTPIAVDSNADVIVGHESPPAASSQRRSFFSGLLNSLNRRNRCAPAQDLRH